MRPAPGYGNPRFSRLLGRKLRAWRLFRRLTADALSVRAGISPDLLSQIEDGSVIVQAHELSPLLAALDVGLYELLTSPGPADRPRSRPSQLPDAATAEA